MNSSPTSNSILETSLANHLESDALFVDQIGKTVARSLDRELAHLSPKVLQRLEQSRELALTQKKWGILLRPQQNQLKRAFFPKWAQLVLSLSY